MQENFEGLDRKFIYQEDIPFEYLELKDKDIIENYYGNQLMYLIKNKAYVLLTKDITEYLSQKLIQTTWRKI